MGRVSVSSSGVVYTTRDNSEINVTVPNVSSLNINPNNNSTYHDYETNNKVAKNNEISNPSTVEQNFREEPFPTLGLIATNAAVVSGGITNVPGLGTVKHYIQDDNGRLIIVNVTEPGHELYPGIVVRELYRDENGDYHILTSGIGNGDWGDLNEFFADWLWADNAERIGRESIYEESLPNPSEALPFPPRKPSLPDWLLPALDPLNGAPGVAPARLGGGGDPLVMDLNGNGKIDLVSLENSSAYFDFKGDGFGTHTGWVAPTDGLLTIDLNGNGKVDGFVEIFSTEYPLSYISADNWQAFQYEQNGFAHLARYDSNGDGMVSSLDTVWNSIKIWQDLNGDGQSEAEEILSLSSQNIASFDVKNYEFDSFAGVLGGGFTREAEGNTISHHSTFTLTDGSIREIVDVANDNEKFSERRNVRRVAA